MAHLWTVSRSMLSRFSCEFQIGGPYSKCGLTSDLICSPDDSHYVVGLGCTGVGVFSGS